MFDILYTVLLGLLCMPIVGLLMALASAGPLCLCWALVKVYEAVESAWNRRE